MTVPSVLVYFVLLVTSAVAYWSLFAGFTGMSKANFRRNLWRLRDELTDEYILHRANPSKGALDLREAVESCIRQSEHFTTFRVLSFYAIWQHSGSPVPDNKLDLKPGGAEDELSDHKKRLAAICSKYLFTNSLLGPFTFLLPLFSFARRLILRFRGGRERLEMRPPSVLAERPIRVDVQGETWANRKDDLKDLVSA